MGPVVRLNVVLPAVVLLDGVPRLAVGQELVASSRPVELGAVLLWDDSDHRCIVLYALAQHVENYGPTA